MKPPEAQPIVHIPLLNDDTHHIHMKSEGRGEKLRVRMWIDDITSPIRVDPDNVWMNREWFGLVLRELDRLGVWMYTVNSKKGIWYWSRRD